MKKKILVTLVTLFALTFIYRLTIVAHNQGYEEGLAAGLEIGNGKN